MFEFFNDLGLAICLFNEASKVKKKMVIRNTEIFSKSHEKAGVEREAYNK